MLRLVIAGNHDLSLDPQYWDTHRAVVGEYATMFSKNGHYDPDTPRLARDMWTGHRAKAANIHYLDEGMHNFTLNNGSTFSIYASPWQPEFCDWAFNYPHDEDRWNPPSLIEVPTAKPAPKARGDPKPIPEGAEVDIVMTHGPAHLRLDRCRDGNRAGCPHLLSALERVRPRLHCCGHIHEAWGAERVEWSSDASDSGVNECQVLAGTLDGRPKWRDTLPKDVVSS